MHYLHITVIFKSPCTVASNNANTMTKPLLKKNDADGTTVLVSLCLRVGPLLMMNGPCR